jgi:hypothetical protein
LSSLDEIHHGPWRTNNDHGLNLGASLNGAWDSGLDSQTLNELANSSDNTLDLAG